MVSDNEPSSVSYADTFPLKGEGIKKACPWRKKKSLPMEKEKKPAHGERKKSLPMEKEKKPSHGERKKAFPWRKKNKAFPLWGEGGTKCRMRGYKRRKR
ncbi:hypothetical protein [Butyrivibrio sp. AE3004]|uniref:hypothetical protein n=1 Tax=Butyrivibrio sp. AE3004 TaxID=1506994 RepID=UPI0018CBFB33|nr:hypothetical protein [Butyrivibrio sp. AE3004]